MEGQKNNEQNLKNTSKNGEVAVVIVPFPAQGHLNQLLHLSHLITSYKIPVHFACSPLHNTQAKLRCQGWNSKTLSEINFHDFELPPYNSPPPNPHATSHFPSHHQPLFDASMHLRQPVCQLMKELATKFRKLVVIHDSLVAYIVQDARFISNAESYVFNSISAFSLFYFSWLRLETKPFELDHNDIPTQFPAIKGCFTPEIIELIQKQQHLRQESHQSGMIFNTCRLIEGKYVDLVGKLSSARGKDDMKLFAIGPFNPVEIKSKSNSNDDQIRHPCLEWLDKQEKNSVIYISFGSTTTMSDEQVRELALGLETSEQKFIWVVRNADSGDSFVEDEVTRPKLPEDYEERVKNQGMIVRKWAPQLEILGHSSVGVFMCHCGWNSCMESISNGVPMAAWPRHSEQPMNAVLITQVLGIGCMVKNWSGKPELAMSEDIEKVIRRLMVSKEGDEMRNKAEKLGESVRGLAAKNGGVSNPEIESFIAHITR